MEGQHLPKKRSAHLGPRLCSLQCVCVSTIRHDSSTTTASLFALFPSVPMAGPLPYRTEIDLSGSLGVPSLAPKPPRCQA